AAASAPIAQPGSLVAAAPASIRKPTPSTVATVGVSARAGLRSAAPAPASLAQPGGLAATAPAAQPGILAAAAPASIRKPIPTTATVADRTARRRRRPTRRRRAPVATAASLA